MLRSGNVRKVSRMVLREWLWNQNRLKETVIRYLRAYICRLPTRGKRHSPGKRRYVTMRLRKSTRYGKIVAYRASSYIKR